MLIPSIWAKSVQHPPDQGGLCLRMAPCSGCACVWKGETHFRIIPLPSQSHILPGGVNCYYYYITSKMVTGARACVQVGLYLCTGTRGEWENSLVQVNPVSLYTVRQRGCLAGRINRRAVV